MSAPAPAKAPGAELSDGDFMEQSQPPKISAPAEPQATTYVPEKDTVLSHPANLSHDQVNDAVQTQVFGRPRIDTHEDAPPVSPTLWERYAPSDETLNKFGGEALKGVARGAETIGVGLAGLVKWFAENSVIDAEGRAAGTNTHVAKLAQSAVDYLKKRQESGAEAQDPEVFRGSFMTNPSFTRLGADVAQSVPVLGAAALLTIGTGDPLAGAAALGLLSGGEQYAASREAGQSPERAGALATASLIGNTLLMNIPLGRALEGFGETAVKGALRGAAEFGAVGAIQTPFNNFVAKLGGDKSRTLFEGMAESILANAVSGGILGAFTPGRGAQIDDLIQEAHQAGISGAEIDTARAEIARALMRGEVQEAEVAPKDNPLLTGPEAAPQETDQTAIVPRGTPEGPSGAGPSAIETVVPKAARYDDRGLPVRRPGSVVATVETSDGERVRITHQMILDEAQGLLDQAKEQQEFINPLGQFVTENGGIRGFKGGAETEEFKKVPVRFRGQLAADEMAQMAFDNGLLDEPSADLLRDTLAAIPGKGKSPKLADFYTRAQHSLEQYYSSLGGGEFAAEKQGAYSAGEPAAEKLPSPYVQADLPLETAQSDVPAPQGANPAPHPTVRGGFRALQTPHLEVEFQTTGAVVIPNRQIDSPADLAYAFKFLHKVAQENFFLGAIKNNRIVAVEHLGFGTIDQVAAYPFETISLIDKNAADGFFVVHNHPSGYVNPSQDDLRLTNTIRSVLEKHGAEFKGHIIIDDTKFGFIAPDGRVSEIEHAEYAKTKKLPILRKYFEWSRSKQSIMDGPTLGSPEKVFELVKGIQRGDSEGIAYLLDVQNQILNAVVLPHGKFDSRTLQSLGAAYRSPSMILVNSGLPETGFHQLNQSLRAASIQVLDDIALEGNSYQSRRQKFGEPQGRYNLAAREEGGLFQTDKENLADRYERLRQEALERGLSIPAAARWAKERLGQERGITVSNRSQQMEFGAQGGVQGFGRGKQGEGELFERGPGYGAPPSNRPPITAGQGNDSGNEFVKNKIFEIAPGRNDREVAKHIRQEFSGLKHEQIVRGNQLAQEIKRLVPSKTEREGMFWYRAANGDLNVLADALSNPALAQYHPQIEAALTLSPDAHKALAKVDKYFEESGRVALETGAIRSIRQNYMNRIYEPEPPKQFVKSETKQDLKQTTAHAKRRVFNTEFEAVEAGKKFASTDIAETLPIHNEEMARVNTSRKMVDAMQAGGLGAWSKEAPEGWKRIGTLEKAAPIKDKDGNPVIGEDGNQVVSRSAFYAPEGIAKALEAIADPNWAKKIDSLRNLQKYQGLVKTVDLSFSLFHHLSMTAVAAYQGGVGNLLRLPWMTERLASPEFGQLEQDFARHGGVTSKIETNQDILRNLVEAKTDTFSRITNLPGVKQILKAAEGNAEFLFGKLQRYLKVTDYGVKMANWAADNSTATNAEVKAAKIGFTKEINAAYGGLNWDALGMSKANLSLLRLGILAPDWTISNALTLGYALGLDPDFAGTPKSMGKSGTAGSAARAHLLTALIGGMALTEVLNKLLTGHFTDENPKGHGLEIQLSPGVYVSLLRGPTGDITKWASMMRESGPIAGTARFSQGKLAPLARTAVGAFSGVQYTGRPIVAKGESPTVAYLKYLLANAGPAPFGLTNLAQYLKQRNATVPGAVAVGTGLGRFSKSRNQGKLRT